MLSSRQWKSVEVRRAVLSATLSLETAATIPLLIEFLEDRDVGLQVKALDRLAELQAEAAIDEIGELLLSESFPRRLKAVYALQKIGGKPVVPYLLKVLTTTDPSLRLAAGNALKRSKNKLTNEQLMPLLRSEDPHVRLLYFDLGAPSVVDVQAIRTGLKDMSPLVRERALLLSYQRRFTEIGFDEISVYLRDRNARVRAAGVVALSAVRHAKVASTISKMCDDPDPIVRRQIARIAMNRPTAEGRSLSDRLSRDKDPSVRAEAQAAARVIQGKSNK